MCGQRLSTACTCSPSANRHSTRAPAWTTRRPASRNSASEAARTRCSVPLAVVDATKVRYNLKYGLSQGMPEELTIGEAAARSGVAPSALRFYEAQGYQDVGASVYTFENDTYETRLLLKPLSR